MGKLPYKKVVQVTFDPHSLLPLELVIVVDTNALLSSIDNQCRTGRRSLILRIAESRTAKVFAADHVYDETYRGFAKIAASKNSTSVVEMRACFEEHYLPVLRWVTTSVNDIWDERVHLVTDEDDAPTAHLASLIAPCVVMSADKHLRRPGFAPDEWRLAAAHGASFVKATSQKETVLMAISLPVVAVVDGGIKFHQIARLPAWALPALIVGCGYLIFRSPRRRKTIGEAVWPFVEAIEAEIEQVEVCRQTGAHGLKKAMLEPAEPPTVKQQIATVLARSRQPLLAGEIQELIETNFGRDGVPAIVEVRDILKASSEFTQPERYRWQLGRVGGPRR